MSATAVRDFRYDLGAPPEELRKSLWIQLLIRVTGPGMIESVRIKSNRDPGGENQGNSGACVLLSEVPACDDTFNPFEYSE